MANDDGDTTMTITRKCYAHTLGDCDGPLSREHYLSAGILRALDDGGGVRISGLPFLEGRTERLPPNAFAAKILCQKHNAELSPLDAEVLRLFNEIMAIDGLSEVRGRQLPVTFDGNFIERWFLKFMLGVIAGGLARKRDGTVLGPDIPEKFVRICFGLQSHDLHTGLYVDGAVGDVMTRTEVGLTVGLMLNPDDTLANIQADVNRLHLVHHLHGTKPTPSLNHRPREIRFVHEGSRAEKSFRFKWMSSHGGDRFIQILVHPRPQQTS
jgi:hypothetical protein